MFVSWWWCVGVDAASEATDVTPASSVRTTSIDDDQTDHQQHQHQQHEQQDSVDDTTDDNSQPTTSGTESEDQFSDANTKHSSSCQFPTNVVAMSTVKCPTGIYRTCFDQRHPSDVTSPRLFLPLLCLLSANFRNFWPTYTAENLYR